MPDVRTTHPTPQQLANYGLGKLPAAELASIHAHLAGCEECRRKVENLPPDSFIGQIRAAMPSGASLMPTIPPVPSDTVLPKRRQSAAGSHDDVPAELAASSKFEILCKLGQGGMGAVYKAKHTFLGELVAIKVMTAAVVDNPVARNRFLREMQATGKLKHPNIVRALDAEQIGDLLILVMEFVPGIALDRLVKQRGPLPVDFACDCIMQAASGLQHAHEKGMVHRDIKPANLMVTAKEKEVKLVDFGLVCGPSVQTGTRQTQLQAFMGTPEYVAPEQAGDARNADIRADVYSLGCTLYFLLAGRPPFKSDSIMGTIIAHAEAEARPLPELRAEVPAGLWAVVAKMMAKTPAERYQTPIEVAQALKPFVVGGKARGADARPVEAGPALDHGAPTVLPTKIPPVPAPPRAKMAPVAGKAATGTRAAPPRPRREKAKEKRPTWLVGAAVASGLLVAVMGAMVVTQFNASRQRQGEAEEARQLHKEAEGVAEETRQREDERQKQAAAETTRKRQKEAEAQQKEQQRKQAAAAAETIRKRQEEAEAQQKEEQRKQAEAARLRKEQARAAAASLRVEPEAVATIWRGKRTMLQVRLRRQGYPGEIGLRVDGLPAQVRLAKPVVLLASQETAEIELVAAAEGPEAESQVTVSATLDEAQVKRTLRLRVLKEWEKEITNSIGMKLVLIPAGTFTMGSSKAEQDAAIADFEKALKKKASDMTDVEKALKKAGSDKDRSNSLRHEGPQHEVEITKPFYMGMYAVTQGEFKEVMGYNPSVFSRDGKGKTGVTYKFCKPAIFKNKVPADTSRFPVENVSWEEAQEFCEKLTKDEKAKRREYRLPTEAEWEYACRAGTKTRYYTGDDKDDLKKAAWYDENSGGRTHRVGEKKPNAWGLYDMHGNLSQWCSDWYGKDYYLNSDKKDPIGPVNGAFRVLRGSDWLNRACRAADRCLLGELADRSPNAGFRVVCVTASDKEDRQRRLAKKTGEEVDRLLADSKKAMTNKQYAVAVGLLAKAKEIAPANRSVLDALLKAQKALDAEVAALPLPGKEITNSIGMKLVRIPAGTFKMGSPTDESVRKDEEQHEVEITKAFWLGVHEVTQKQFKDVMGYNPSLFSRDGEGKTGVTYFQKPGGGKAGVPADTSDFPVENVSWEEAKEFCEKLTALAAEKMRGRTYRLPTEAEWEYSCRGGASSYQVFHFGNSLTSSQANFSGAGKNPNLHRTCKVGSYKANGFGLYDMHGNVGEWCSDWYGQNYYGKSPPRDPPGPSGGSYRVIRGGSWHDRPLYGRSACRSRIWPAFRIFYLGFRVALVPSGK